MKNFLHIFLILSFVLAGISPACKFISGEVKQIEICSYDGIKTITVTDHKTPDDKEHKKADDCAFCFVQSHLKLAKATLPTVTPVETAYQNPAFMKPDAQFSRHELDSLSPRAPPSFQA